MKPAAAVACLVSMLAGGAAHAGGYLGVAVGPGASVSGDLSDHVTGEGHTSGRILIGHGIGPLALEASLFGSDLSGISPLAGGNADFRTYSLGVDLRLNLPVADRLDLTLRGGLDKTWLTASADSALESSGQGRQLAVGLSYELSPVPLVHAALFLEYTRQWVTLDDEAAGPIDGTLGTIMFGVTLGAL